MMQGTTFLVFFLSLGTGMIAGSLTPGIHGAGLTAFALTFLLCAGWAYMWRKIWSRS